MQPISILVLGWGAVLAVGAFAPGCGDSKGSTSVHDGAVAGAGDGAVAGGGTGGTSGILGTGGANSTGGRPGTGGSGALLDACVQLETAAMQKEATCSPIIVQAVYGDDSAFLARLPLLCSSITSLPGLALAVADFQACAQFYQTSTCEEVLYADPSSSCFYKPGTLADGAACVIPLQCQSAYCKTNGTSHCGVCAPRNPLGGSCQEYSECQTGLYCNFGAPPVCIEPGKAGSVCDATHPCLLSLTCLQGTCAPFLGTGAACSTSAECDYRRGLYCNTTSGRCEMLTIAQPGQACGPTVSVGVECWGNGHCAGATATTGGTCMVVAADGAACDSSNGPTCGVGAECLNGICTTATYPTCR